VNEGVDGSSGDRWGELFGDLEGEFEAELARDTDVEIADRVRYELGQVSLLERFRASGGSVVQLGVRGQPALGGRLADVGADWVSVTDTAGLVMIAVRGIVWVEGLRQVGAAVAAPTWAVADLRRSLRDLAQARGEVRLGLDDGSAVHGTLSGVFADHVDVACHPPGRPPRTRAVTARRSVPLSAVVTVRQLT